MKAFPQHESYLFGAFLSSRADFETTPIKLQRIRHRQGLPPLFLRKLRDQVRGKCRASRKPYRSKHMCAFSASRCQICLSSSVMPIVIRPEELRLGLLASYLVFQLFEAHKRPVFKDFFVMSATASKTIPRARRTRPSDHFAGDC
jgi:hypothetical protein